MDELTNQSFESEADDSFEIEEVNEESHDDGEEAETEVSETEEHEEPEADDFSLDIRYNGQNQTLNREQATTLAQKGMNYDKINEKLQQALNNPVLKIVENNAKKAGLSVEEYANRMAQFQDSLNIQQIAREFKNQNPDVSDAVATQYASEVYKNRQAESAKQEAEKARQTAQAEQDALISEVKAFQERFPDVDIESLPNEVIDDINLGTPLMEAYLTYENQQLRNRLANTQTNARNRNNSVGKVSDNTGSATGTDPFIQGLLD
jgi:hypothetical protein